MNKMKKTTKNAKTIKATFVKEAPAAKYGKGTPAPVPAPKAHVPVKADAKKVAETAALAKAVKDAPAAKPAKAAKAEKAPKQPKEKPFTKSMVEVDTKAYQQKHDKLPGTGKREPKTVWRFLIGTTPFSMETEFFRTARMAAVEKAVALKCTKVTVVA